MQTQSSNPRHSTNLKVWAEARQPFIRQIEENARIDREKNPEFQRHQRLVNLHLSEFK